MTVEQIIKESEWWRLAQNTPDRHYPPDAGVSLADHLDRVLQNLQFLGDGEMGHPYFSVLNRALVALQMDPLAMVETLAPVALLHDIGKTKDDKNADIEHPITGKMVKKRHPILGVCAALELLPADLPRRETVVTLIEEHDTPYSWYVQHQRSGQIPGRKAWARLDRKINAREDGSGLVLLALFKIADVDGHENVDDVPWFIDQCNCNYLDDFGKTLPIPSREVVKGLVHKS
jgi:hypothetical protein